MKFDTTKVVKKLSVETPSPQLVDGYLTEISKAYGVKWSSSTTHVVFKDEADKPVCVTSSVIDLLTDLLQNQIHTPEQTSESLPSYSEEGPIIAKLPDLPPTEEEEEKDTRKPNTTTTSAKENPEEDFESLTRRFQELKKR